ncbi:MAG TPA: phosphate ABC transporter permease PstA [Candidatus Eisenbacteria bacterium]|nr:phosphate ABC transporter permease PstA [Candidatus Eisenbacteria bacterium]
MTSPAPPKLAPLVAHGPSLQRRLFDRGSTVACYVAALIVISPLALILYHVLRLGLPGMTAEFFFNLPKPVGETGGGVANAIVGTALMVLLGTGLSVPIGVGAGLFLAEHGNGRLGTLVRTTADVLSGVPSIVIGVAAYGLVVVPMGHFSGLAGGVALAIIMLPTIVRSTEEVVRLVPRSYREAALALGAPRWRVIQQVVLPAAAPAVLTAVLLALARAAGETAPLLFTALGSRFWSLSLTQPMASLPVYIFDYARAPYDDWNRQAWSAASVLLVLVTLVSALVRFTVRRVPRR